MSKLPVRIRDAQEEDYPFIFNSFLKSYCGPFIRHHGGSEVVEPTTFFTGFHRVMSSLLSKRRVLVACPDDSPEVICGWMVGDSLSKKIVVLDFAFVKKDFRDMGIARLLYQAMGGNIEAKVAFTLYHARAIPLLTGRCETYQYVPFFLLEDWSK